jgi:hypothetical protein
VKVLLMVREGKRVCWGLRRVPGRINTREDLKTLEKAVGNSGSDCETRKKLLTQVESTDLDKRRNKAIPRGFPGMQKLSRDASRRRLNVWKAETPKKLEQFGEIPKEFSLFPETSISPTSHTLPQKTLSPPLSPTRTSHQNINKVSAAPSTEKSVKHSDCFSPESRVIYPNI